MAALLVLLLPAPNAARAQRVEAHLLADSVQVGERFRLALVADHNFMTEVQFPAATADSGAVGAGQFGDLVVLALRDSSRRYLGQNGLRRDSVVYEVTTFALDTARVAPIPVAFVQNGDTVRTAVTDARRLPVASVLPDRVRTGQDSAQLKPLAPPVPFPFVLWPWLLGAAGALLLAALLAYLWWNRRAPASADAAPRQAPVPPAEAARRRLRRLEETTDLDDPDAAKTFYTELSQALRRYLMHRLGLRAFRNTTGELVAQIQRRTAEGTLPDETPRHVRRTLEGADLAKFADQRPPAEARRDALAEAHAAIDAVEEALAPTEDEAPEDETPEDEAPAGAASPAEGETRKQKNGDEEKNPEAGAKADDASEKPAPGDE